MPHFFSGCYRLAAAGAEALLFVLVDAEEDEERDDQYDHDADDEHEVAAAEVVALDAVPHIEHSAGLGVAVVHECAAVDDALVGIEHLVGVDSRSVLAEEVREVNGLGVVLSVVSPLEDLGRSDDADVTDLLHVLDSVLRHTEVVDEVRSSLDVLRILRDAPSVKPYVRALVGHAVLEGDAYLFSFVDSPLCVA